MSTVGELVDRVFRDLLLPADDQPTRTALTAGVTDVATSIPYDGTVLAADEEELLAPGVVVEVGQEQMLVEAADLNANTLTVRRGVNGTDNVAHADGDLIAVAPPFGRRAVFDAVADNVVALYPGLFRVATTTLTVGSVYTEVPAGVVTPVSFVSVSGSRYRNVSVEFWDNFTPSSTAKAIMTPGVASGSTGYFTYRGKFDRPTSEADDLQTLGVDLAWERIVAVGAAVQLLAGRELDSVNSEFVTEAMRSEGYPVGSAQRQRDGLIRFYEWLVEQARHGQLASHAEVVSMNAV